MNSGQPIVSVIVPVYNEQEMLGYCLNSLVSQTYVYLDIIVIDDGSTDASFSICSNYAQLYPFDGEQFPKIRVLEQSNRGVSFARNTGLDAVTGEFLYFLDSDDMLETHAIEKLVDAAHTYKADLVCCGLVCVDLPSFLRRGMEMRIGNAFGQEIVMDGISFRQHLMQLIAHTYMLEGVYGKLYRRETWEKIELRFQPDLSLGEDFIANLEYFNICNRVAMIDELLVYYNTAFKENSLSKCYRADRFDIQVRILSHLNKYLIFTQENPVGEKERAEFYAYANAHISDCIQEVVANEDKRTLEEQKYSISCILNHPFARECALRTTWWKPGLEDLKRAYENFDVLCAINVCKDMLNNGAENPKEENESQDQLMGSLNEERDQALQQEDADRDMITETICVIDEPDTISSIDDIEQAWRSSIGDRAGQSLFNKLVRAILRMIGRVSSDEKRKLIEKQEEIVYWHGVRYAFWGKGK